MRHESVNYAVKPDRLAAQSAGTSSKPLSDIDLITAVAADESTSMAVIYKRYRTFVYRYIMKIVKDPNLADDLTSDVFVEVWRKASKFENRAQLSTWILAIARFKALGSLRRARQDLIELTDFTDPSRTGTLDAESLVDLSGHPEDRLMETDEHTQIRSYVLKLSPVHQQIIDLFYYREKTIDEIAAAVGVSKNTVKTRAFYARVQLAKLVSAGKTGESSLRARGSRVEVALGSRRRQQTATPARKSVNLLSAA
jgi:RNA polymerase sigma-70 factor, ECF subfamily